MKKLFCSCLCLVLFSYCAVKKESHVYTRAELRSACPKNANCTLELFPNKSMVVKRDEWGNLSYSLEDRLGKNVFLYSYSRIVKGNIQDAGYREEIVFELYAHKDLKPLTDEALQNTQMLFGRFCFCKGQTGFYKVAKGSLTASNARDINIRLDFRVTEVPQITTAIAFDLK